MGDAGQAKLGDSRVLLCGCGALGSLIAERLARAGVGSLRIVDRDWVELSNLQRQTLFTEEDAQRSNPKAVAAARVIGQINSDVQVEPVVEDLTHENIAELAAGCDLLLDGMDNFETRFLINDYCVQNQVPWVHGGCLGANGQVLTILPGQTACFRCLVPELPPREALDTCDTAGVLGPAIGIIASWQAAEALKVLSGNRDAVAPGMIVVDCWNTDCRIIKIPRNAACRACGLGEFPFLNGSIRTHATILCGKNAVQVESPTASGESLEQVAQKLEGLGPVNQNDYFLRLQLEDHTITIFKGGRAIVEGTTSEADAKSILARTLGS